MENKTIDEQMKDVNPRGYKFSIRGKLTTFLDMFEDLNKQIVQSGQAIITVDFFIKSITDSSCNIDAAFNRMMEEQNFICAIPFIRMQLDSAMIAWAGLICENEIKFFTSFASGEPVNQSRFSWDSLASQGITKELIEEKGIKVDSRRQMTNRFLYETLNLKFDGFAEMYRKACTYVHPSAALLKASWFTSEVGQVKVKGWEEAQPYNYPEQEIVTDYVCACRSLVCILMEWKKLKDWNSEIYRRIQNGEGLPEGLEVSQPQASQEDLKKLLGVLRHDEGSKPEE